MLVKNTTRRRFTAVGLAALLAIVFVLLVLQALDRVTKPAFCANCHESQGPYLVWAVSSHSKVDCLVCHRQPGTLGGVELALRAASHLYVHVAGVKKEETGFDARIPDTTCQQCHTVRRTVTPGGDLVIPHREHVEKGEARCVDCHYSTVHAGQAGVKATAKIAGQKLDDASQLHNELVPDDFRPRMGTCLECHDGKRAPYKCQACHKDIVTPANHQAPDWPLRHGLTAKRAVAECVYCHALAGGKQASQQDLANLSLQEAVRYNDFCRRCHEKRPPSHALDWSFTHRLRAQQDAGGCLACHTREAQPGKIVACGTCHKGLDNKSSDKDARKNNKSHDDGWLRQHPQVVKEQGLRDCLSCHGSNNCSDCHTQRAADMLQ